MSQALVRMDATQALLGAVALTLALYFLPWLQVLAWPLVLFSTLAHELGHGLMALALGGRFEALVLWPDGSGLAGHSGVAPGWPQALVAAGGLLGPPLVALVLFTASCRRALARAALGLFAIALAACAAIWVRNAFGWVFVGLLAAALAAVALRGSPRTAQLVTVFLALQLSLSVYSRGDYLFTAEARTAGGVFPSDTARIAEGLGLTYWAWGAAVALLSVLILGLGGWLFRRSWR